jgi:hypothetical protein
MLQRWNKALLCYGDYPRVQEELKMSFWVKLWEKYHRSHIFASPFPGREAPLIEKSRPVEEE